MEGGDGLPRVHVDASRRAQYEELCDDLIDHALEAHDRFHSGKGARDWKLIRQKHSLSMYRQRESQRQHERQQPDSLSASSSSSSTEDPNQPLLMCSGVVPGTTEDLLNGTYTDSTESFRIIMSLLTNGKFMDAALVHVFEAHGVQAPVMFSGLKWIAIKSPTSSSLIHDRELLIFQRIGRIVDRHGRYFAYMVTQSVDVPGWPTNIQRNLERAHVSVCILFRQVQDNWVGCFSLGRASMRGALPRQLNELLTAEHLLQLGNFLKVAQAKAFSALMATSAELIPSTSTCCDVCMKANTLLGSRKLCMGCRRHVCRKCREKRVVFRLELRSQQPVKEVFCVQCVAHVTRPKTVAKDQTDPELSGSASASASASASTPADKRSGSSSTPSPHSEVDSDSWLPMPEPELPANLDGLAGFVEASRTQRTSQWNAQELAYLEGLLHGARGQTGISHSDSSSSGGTTTRHHFHAGASLPPRDKSDGERERLARSYADGEYGHGHGAARQDKYFSVDELD